MSPRIYRTRRDFLIPFALVVVFLFFLLVLSFVNGTPREWMVLAAISLVALSLFGESAYRRITLWEGGIKVRTVVQKRELLWDDITQVAALTIRKKVYLLLTTKKGFYILSNTYGDFPSLARDIAGGVGGEKVEPSVRGTDRTPPANRAPVISTWGAVVVIIFMVVGKLFLF